MATTPSTQTAKDMLAISRMRGSSRFRYQPEMDLFYTPSTLHRSEDEYYTAINMGNFLQQGDLDILRTLADCGAVDMETLISMCLDRKGEQGAPPPLRDKIRSRINSLQKFYLMCGKTQRNRPTTPPGSSDLTYLCITKRGIELLVKRLGEFEQKKYYDNALPILGQEHVYRRAAANYVAHVFHKWLKGNKVEHTVKYGHMEKVGDFGWAPIGSEIRFPKTESRVIFQGVSMKSNNLNYRAGDQAKNLEAQMQICLGYIAKTGWTEYLVLCMDSPDELKQVIPAVMKINAACRTTQFKGIYITCDGSLYHYFPKDDPVMENNFARLESKQTETIKEGEVLPEIKYVVKKVDSFPFINGEAE